jgi:hypothetical protein
MDHLNDKRTWEDVFAIDLSTAAIGTIVSVDPVTRTLNQLCPLRNARAVTGTDQKQGEARGSAEPHLDSTLAFDQMQVNGR